MSNAPNIMNKTAIILFLPLLSICVTRPNKAIITATITTLITKLFLFLGGLPVSPPPSPRKTP